MLINTEELFNLIASFMDIKSQLEFAHICKTIYAYYKQRCREENVAFLYSTLPNVNHKYKHRKVLERWLSETGWAAVKAILNEISTDSQSNNGYTIRVLCSDESLQFPDGLEHENINALI
jgi:hypothetical protein